MFTNILERVPIVMWRSVFENTRRMKGFILRALHVVSNGLTPEYCIAAFLFSKRVCYLAKKSGLLYVALYLKQCAVVLMKFYGEDGYSHVLLTPQVSLTRSGLPRIIPPFHRKIIKERTDRSDICVKIYLSWFTLARIVLLAPKVTKKTFASFFERSADIDAVFDFIHGLHHVIRRVIERYIPHHSTIPLYQGVKWCPTWKSLPNRSLFKYKVGGPSIFTSIDQEMKVFDYLTNSQSCKTDEDWRDSVLSLQDEYVLYSGDPVSYEGQKIAEISTSLDVTLLYYELIFSRLEPEADPERKKSKLLLKGAHLGRVSAVMAGAGKRRLFALGNYGIQRLLRPFHDWFMAILRTLPNDGTFNQLRPISKVKGHLFLASFDLKSATDRWPRHFLTVVMVNLFGSRLAELITEWCLGQVNISIGPPLTKRFSTTINTVGSLLGYYGAWPLFALSHHILMWCAAESVYPGRTFRAYAILGDDVIIADRKVSEEYARMLKELGVETSPSKSLISNSGAFEFAKKFYINRGSFDCSPVSLRACLLARSTLGLSTIKRTYQINDYKTLLRLGGAGYRVLSRLSPNRMTGRWKRLLVFFSYDPGFSESLFEWWLCGFSTPINPYLKGRLIYWLILRTKPKQLVLPPKEAYVDEETYELTLEYCEYSLTRSWVERWLKWQLWYSTRLLEGCGTFSVLLDAPIVETSWYRRSVDLTVYRYGLVWRLYDMVKESDSSEVFHILDSAATKARKEQLYYPSYWRLRVITSARFTVGPIRP